MPLFERSFNDIVGDAILDLTTNSRINRISPGSKARAILEAVSRNTNQAYQVFDLNLARAFLSGASGTYIDLIGELMNTPRLGTATAQASASSKVIKFFVDTGNFGGINGGGSISIPAGTLISTSSNNGGVVYRMPTGVTLTNSLSELFIAVEAVSPGEFANVGAGSLRFHNFTNYVDNANNTLRVVNLSGIFNGANTEDDINYKYRVSRSALSSEAANQTAVLLATLSVPGVANVLLQNRAFGIGTFKVLIKSITPSVSEALLDNVQASIESVSALGTKPLADKPNETGMAFTVTVFYQNGVSEAEKDNIEIQVKSSMSDYVNGLDIGEEFVVNELVERVLSVSSSIKDIGTTSKPFDTMSVYKETRLRDSKIRQELIANYIPISIERIIMEPSLQEPITIIRGN
jgi:uncharacterized phage protein gp47/JayE